eukprot:727920-Amphidinium_carterae.1
MLLCQLFPQASDWWRKIMVFTCSYAFVWMSGFSYRSTMDYCLTQLNFTYATGQHPLTLKV